MRREAFLTLALAFGAATLAAAGCGSEEQQLPVQEQADAGEACVVGYEDFAGPFLLNWCVGCHSSSLPDGERQMAPVGINFDTLDGIRAYAARARLRVLDERTMPPVGGPSDEERELFAAWIDCGLPAAGNGFVPPPPTGLMMPNEIPLMGMCAEPRTYIPAGILPRCTESTLDCVVQCGVDTPEYEQEACRNACLAADTTPADNSLGVPVNCANCTLGQLLACADSEGCHDETAAFLCCLEACGGGPECEMQCNGELQVFGLCIYYTAPQCVDYLDGPVGTCFAAPASGSDAGTVADAGN